MYDVAVCDDSAWDRDRLIGRINCLASDKELNIHEFSSGTELLKAMNNVRFAAAFLDIQMKGMDGDETAKRIREIDPAFVLTIYTGSSVITPERFEVTPYRYLMKNMPESQFNEYIKATLDMAERNIRIPMLTANLLKRKTLINSKYVIYIEKYKKSTRAKLLPIAYSLYGIEADDNGKYPDIRISDPLYKTYERLKKYGFGYPHDSYIINFKYVTVCTDKVVRLEYGDNELPIARSKMKEFLALRGEYIRGKYVGSEDDV